MCWHHLHAKPWRFIFMVVGVIFLMKMLFGTVEWDNHNSHDIPQPPAPAVAPQAPVEPSAPAQVAVADDSGFSWGWVALGIGILMTFISLLVMGAAIALVAWHYARGPQKRKNSPHYDYV